MNAKVVDRDANGDDTNGNTQLDGALDDGQHHQEETDDEEQDGEAYPHLWVKKVVGG